MATNTLSAYNPEFFANTALSILKNRFGLARSINRRYDDERKSFEQGDVVTVRRPSSFTAQDAPSSAQNINAGKVQFTLDKFKEVKFEVPDKEMAFTGDRLIREHIAPAATALSTQIETDLNTMAIQVPHAFIEPAAGTAATIAGIMGTWRKLFDNKCPTLDEDNMFFELGGKEKADLTQLAAFSQWQGAGQVGVNTQITGMLGKRYGFNFWETQLRPTVTYADITDKAGAINNASGYAAGSTSIAVDALDASGVYKKGTIIKMTLGPDLGSEYTLTADATMSSGGATITISPPLRNAVVDNDTFDVQTEQDNVADFVNLAYHRDFAGVVFAPLPDFRSYRNNLGADVATVTDEDSGISLRARFYYIGDSSKMHCALDALYGFKLLQPEFGCRYEIKQS